MIRKIIFALCYAASTPFLSFAQDTTTNAYELQRTKINNLLAERSAKFGKYDESLNAKTGIFGFQTKRDIKNSNEILRQIAINDNNIFTELKVLLQYKDLQFQEIKTTVNHSQQRIDAYKKTIRDLQVKNEELLNYNVSAEKSIDYKNFIIITLLVFSAIVSFLLYKKQKMLKNSSAVQKTIKVL